MNRLEHKLFAVGIVGAVIGALVWRLWEAIT